MWELFHLLLCGKHVLFGLESQLQGLFTSLSALLSFLQSPYFACDCAFFLLYPNYPSPRGYQQCHLYHLPQPQNPQQLAPCSFWSKPQPLGQLHVTAPGQPLQTSFLAHPGLFLSGLSLPPLGHSCLLCQRWLSTFLSTHTSHDY